jgi:hypothetical protein
MGYFLHYIFKECLILINTLFLTVRVNTALQRHGQIYISSETAWPFEKANILEN